MMEISEDLRAYIEGIPKAELHIHIEGTFEPELMEKIANRNGLPFEGTPELHREMRKHFKVCGPACTLHLASWKAAHGR